MKSDAEDVEKPGGSASIIKAATSNNNCSIQIETLISATKLRYTQKLTSCIYPIKFLRCRLADKFFDAKSHSVIVYFNKHQISQKTVTVKVHFVQRLTGLKNH